MSNLMLPQNILLIVYFTSNWKLTSYLVSGTPHQCTNVSYIFSKMLEIYPRIIFFTFMSLFPNRVRQRSNAQYLKIQFLCLISLWMNHQYYTQLYGYIPHFENHFYTKMKWKLHLIAHFWAQKVQKMSTIYTVMSDQEQNESSWYTFTYRA